MWFRHTFKQVLKNPFLWLISILLVVGIYKHYQDNVAFNYNLYEIQIRDATDQRNALSYQKQVLELNPPTDNQELQQQYIEILDEQYQILSEIIMKGWSEDSGIAPLEYQFWQKQAQLNQLDEIAPTVAPELVDLKLRRADYMMTHELEQLNEQAPTDSAIFTLQVSRWLYSPILILIILLFFGRSFFKDHSTDQIDFYYTLPIERKVILRKYLDEVSLATFIFTLVPLLMSTIPVLMAGNMRSFIYPVFIGGMLTSMAMAPVWQVIILRIIVFILLVFLFHIFVMFLAYWIPNQEGNLFVTLVIGGLLFVVARLGGFQLWNPISYLVDFDGFFVHAGAIYGLLMLLALIFGLLSLIYLTSYTQVLVDRFNHQQFTAEIREPAHKAPARDPQFYLEWLKRWESPGRPILLASVILLAVGSYSYLLYKDYNAQTHLGQDVEVLANQLADQLETQETQLDIAFAELEYFRQDEYEATRQEGQSFVDWLQENDPENYQALTQSYEGNQKYDELYRDVLAQIVSGAFSDEAYIDFENSKYDLYMTYHNPYTLDRYDPNIANNFKTLMEHETIKTISESSLNPIMSTTYLSQPQFLPSWKVFEPTVLHTAYFFAENSIDLLIIGGLMILFMTTIGEEFGRRRHMEFYLTQPVQRHQLFWTKLRFNSVLIFGGILLMGIAMFLIPLLVGGWGQADYPIPVFVSRDVRAATDFSSVHFASLEGVSFMFIPLIRYIWQHLVLVLGIASFMTAWLFFIGLFIPNRLIGLLAAITSAGGLWWISQQSLASAWHRFNPFVFLYPRDISDGWFNSLSNQSYYTPLQGALVLFVSSLLLILLTYAIWYSLPLTRQEGGSHRHDHRD